MKVRRKGELSLADLDRRICVSGDERFDPKQRG
jgi:hypothetical protein